MIPPPPPTHKGPPSQRANGRSDEASLEHALDEDEKEQSFSAPSSPKLSPDPLPSCMADHEYVARALMLYSPVWTMRRMPLPLPLLSSLLPEH